ncbi:MAG: KEOPS complex subunit Cgi121 [Candidatus Ranarchaeia archaeon]
MILETLEHWIGVFGATIQSPLDIDKVVKKLKEISEPRKTTIQLLNADLIATWEHLYFSTIQAENSVKNGTAIAKSLILEIMLHASGQRQIDKAIHYMGININLKNVAILFLGKSREDIIALHQETYRIINGLENPMLIDITDQKIKKLKKYFEISEEEIQAIKKTNPKMGTDKIIINIIIERSAKLTLEKRNKKKFQLL